ncbi:MAG TPA: hypothetical protein VHY10_17460 [Xanthobacteraceae bacterium]|jgi:hypothetical protein|nr:hypothetical protein [Xanthobacteraceae bacterium]
MITVIDSSRAEMLCEVRAKRETALRCARTGDFREQEFWLAVVGRMTTWIEHLEMHDATDAVAPTQPKAARIAVPEKVGAL